MNGDPIIAHVLFTDGARRAVYLEAGGNQYTAGDKKPSKRECLLLGSPIPSASFIHQGRDCRRITSCPLWASCEKNMREFQTHHGPIPPHEKLVQRGRREEMGGQRKVIAAMNALLAQRTHSIVDARRRISRPALLKRLPRAVTISARMFLVEIDLYSARYAFSSSP